MIHEIEAAIHSKKRLKELDQAVEFAQIRRDEFTQTHKKTLTSLYEALPEKDCSLVHYLEGETWLIRSEFWDDGDSASIWIERVQTAKEVAEG